MHSRAQLRGSIRGGLHAGVAAAIARRTAAAAPATPAAAPATPAAAPAAPAVYVASAPTRAVAHIDGISGIMHRAKPIVPVAASTARVTTAPSVRTAGVPHRHVDAAAAAAAAAALRRSHTVLNRQLTRLANPAQRADLLKESHAARAVARSAPVRRGAHHVVARADSTAGTAASARITETIAQHVAQRTARRAAVETVSIDDSAVAAAGVASQ